MEEQRKRYYKVEAGDIFEIKRNDFNQYTFYKISVVKKNFDGTKTFFDKSVKFKKGVDIPDRTKIRILDFFEDVRENPKDKYNPIFSLVITEYEIVEDSSDAIAGFNAQMDETDLGF